MAAEKLSPEDLARVRASALAKIPRHRLAQMLPRIIERGDRHGVDLRGRIRALAEGLHLRSAVEEETAYLYQELADAAAKRDHERYAARRARLRELREAEARRVGAHFDQRMPLKAEDVDKLIRDTRAMLGKNEDPSGSDPAAR